VICHRGYHNKCKENSYEAFAEAVSFHNVMGIEADVRLTSDGKLILMHDRVANSKLTIARSEYDEICQELDFVVPELSEALKRWPDILWNIEIKVIEALAPTLDVLSTNNLEKRPLITSFLHSAIFDVIGHIPADFGIVIASNPSINCKPWSSPASGPQINCVVVDYEILDDRLVNLIKDDGLEIYAYGMVTRQEHRRCEVMKLDGIITDYPERLNYESF
jgi:glycerophosphoryl diester phosphodiesterase